MWKDEERLEIPGAFPCGTESALCPNAQLSRGRKASLVATGVFLGANQSSFELV
jgi:hypothetical protein